MSDSLRLHFLFEKYLRKQCQPEEVEELIRLIQNDREDLLTGPMQELWMQVRNESAVEQVDWDSMLLTIRSHESLPSSILPGNTTMPRKIRFAILAASIFSLIVAAVVLWTRSNQKTEKAVAKSSSFYKQEMASQPRRQTIVLHDGSVVVLNANSKLIYPNVFSGKKREVTLFGEAFFDIRHKPGQPFLVHAGGLTTRVLGTAFDIKAYATEDTIEVTVTRGKVQVLKDKSSLGLITANEQLRFSSKTEAFEQKKVDIRPVIAWKPNEIVFDDRTMEEVAESIRNRFHTEVIFANPAIRNCHVSATFSEEDKPEEIISVVCAVTRTNYKIEHHTIIIDGNACE